MSCTYRATLMRISLMAVAVAFMFRALFIDRGDLGSASFILIAALAYEGFYQIACRQIDHCTMPASTRENHAWWI